MMQIKNFRSNFPRLFEGHSVTRHLKVVCHIFVPLWQKGKEKKKVEFNASLLSDFGSKQGRSSWSKHKKQEGKCSNFFILYHLPFVSFFKRGEFVDTLYLVRYLFYA